MLLYKNHHWNKNFFGNSTKFICNFYKLLHGHKQFYINTNLLSKWKKNCYFGCFFHRSPAHVGIDRKRSEQTIQLYSSRESLSTVLLKLLRVLGKYNEFECVDRDQFVSVKWDNIQPGENTYSLLTYAAICLIINFEW